MDAEQSILDLAPSEIEAACIEHPDICNNIEFMRMYVIKHRDSWNAQFAKWQDNGNTSQLEKWFPLVLELAYDQVVNEYDHPLFLQDAAALGQFNIVSIYIQDPRGDSSGRILGAIRHAARTNQLRVVKYFLRMLSPSLTVRGYSLEYAAEGGYLDMVRLLLADSRVSIDNPLLAAVKYNRDEMVSFLLQDERTSTGAQLLNAFATAVRLGKLEFAKLMFAHPRLDLSERGSVILIDSKTAAITRLLLSDPRVFVSKEAIYTAIRDEKHDILSLLLARARGNVRQFSAEFINMALNDIETLKVLLSDPRIDPHMDGGEALVWSVKLGVLENVELLFPLSEDPKTNAAELLPIAIERKHQDVVEYLEHYIHEH